MQHVQFFFENKDRLAKIIITKVQKHHGIYPNAPPIYAGVGSTGIGNTPRCVESDEESSDDGGKQDVASYRSKAFGGAAAENPTKKGRAATL